MANYILIIFTLIISFLLGSIASQEVCKVSQQDLGTGTPIMKVLCIILSIPYDLMAILLVLTGIISYLIWKDSKN